MPRLVMRALKPRYPFRPEEVGGRRSNLSTALKGLVRSDPNPSARIEVAASVLAAHHHTNAQEFIRQVQMGAPAARRIA